MDRRGFPQSARPAARLSGAPARPQANTSGARPSGIRLQEPQRGSPSRPMRRTLVELPFTEVRPTIITHRAGQALGACQEALRDLPTHERDIVLANLLSLFGETS